MEYAGYEKRKICVACDADAEVSIDGNFYCKKHYYHIKTHGKILERTRYDNNEIIIYENYAEIVLYDRSNKEKCRALIDIEDIEKVIDYKWCCRTSKYVVNLKFGLYLHNLVMDFESNRNNMVDHINRNRLDNRKSNLRIVDAQRNAINKGVQSNNTSGFPGVVWDKSKQKWMARLKINKKEKFLGYFSNIEDAIQRRKQAEIEYFGEEVNREFDNNTVFKNKKKGNNNAK